MDQASYPGENASAAQLAMLAAQFEQAAHDLLARCAGSKRPASLAPARLCAIHAVELYLNAYLLRAGLRAAEIRGFQHDLAVRGDRAVAAGLRWRRKTHEHLRAMSREREYLLVRYSPDCAGQLSQANRLMATLAEVARKTTAQPIAVTASGSGRENVHSCARRRADIR